MSLGGFQVPHRVSVPPGDLPETLPRDPSQRPFPETLLDEAGILSGILPNTASYSQIATSYIIDAGT